MASKLQNLGSKLVGYYDLSVLSMSVMGFPKKIEWGVGGWCVWIFGIVLTLKSPLDRIWEECNRNRSCIELKFWSKLV